MATFEEIRSARANAHKERLQAAAFNEYTALVEAAIAFARKCEPVVASTDLTGNEYAAHASAMYALEMLNSATDTAYDILHQAADRARQKGK